MRLELKTAEKHTRLHAGTVYYSSLRVEISTEQTFVQFKALMRY